MSAEEIAATKCPNKHYFTVTAKLAALERGSAPIHRDLSACNVAHSHGHHRTLPVVLRNMGVKELWSILSPLCDRKPLYELQGKTVAVDLSCWVVSSQTVNDHSTQPKMYLRNLYFRTAILLMHGVSPVFVLEGKPPKLKHDAMERRNELRYGFRERKRTKRGNRPQLKRILKECREMLRIMGLACVQGHGEAEAMCAYLNQDGLVDGCISQDSDCFLYGAKVVYRNFCTSAQGNRGGSNGAVDEYSLEKIEKVLNLGRNKMIALALLCGCDYSDGICGVGKEAALKLFKLTKEEDILERIKDWRRDDSLDGKEEQLTNPNLCSTCGHTGKMQKHVKSGCADCGTTARCHDFYRERRALILNEIALRKMALAIQDFPNQELIDEFLTRKDPVPTKVDIEWKQPQLNEFIVFMQSHLSWDAKYAFSKIFPLVTRWQLTQLPTICISNRPKTPNLFVPELIKKVRNIKSVASYEILWKCNNEAMQKLRELVKIHNESEDDEDNVEDGDKNEENHILTELTSIEPQEVVQKCYPELILAFEDSRNNKRKKKRVKAATQSQETSLKPKTNRRHLKKKKNETLYEENSLVMDENSDENISTVFEESGERLGVTSNRSKLSGGSRNNPKPNLNPKHGAQSNRLIKLQNEKLNDSFDKMFDELSSDDFNSDVDDDFNMSRIIDDICSENISQFAVKVTEMEKYEDEEKEDIGNNDLIIIDDEVELNKDEIVEIREESDDEFAHIDEAYVPLNKRILINM